MVKWQWSSFNDLSTADLYSILQIRQAVFAVEQDCVYQDCDDLDQSSWHLIGWRADSGNKEILAYLRVIYPKHKYPEPSIGRVLTSPAARGTGLGKAITAEALERIALECPGTPVRISAQQYLEKFYSDFGFEAVGQPYDEDGIAHIEMLRKGSENATS